MVISYASMFRLTNISVSHSYIPLNDCLNVIISTAESEQGSEDTIHSEHDIRRKVNAQTRHNDK